MILSLPAILYTHPLADNLSTKSWVAMQLQIILEYKHTCTQIYTQCTHAHTAKTVVVIAHQKWCIYLVTYSTWSLMGAAHQNMVEIFTPKVVVKHPK